MRRIISFFPSIFILFLAAYLLLGYLSCQFQDPEVIIINKTSPEIMLRNTSYNGIIWNTVLNFKDATSPRRCLTGKGHVHFQKMDVHDYCRHQTEYGLLDSVCWCDTTASIKDSDVIGAEPIWFNYRTISRQEAGFNDLIIFEITLDDIEQDFSISGPYGH